VTPHEAIERTAHELLRQQKPVLRGGIDIDGVAFGVSLVRLDAPDGFQVVVLQLDPLTPEMAKLVEELISPESAPDADSN
jgi:hypothetical protein